MASEVKIMSEIKIIEEGITPKKIVIEIIRREIPEITMKQNPKVTENVRTIPDLEATPRIMAGLADVSNRMRVVI